ncbi:MAG: hypothetical protein GY750_03655 [Lentisphaerae bacterium]|nr:hypothetical protein [Lentisphaerota bacterium]MCP4100512.1 hypothetical protein [Lentisphaerota bacterium]
MLKDENIALENITKWTVGSGPGSFTGMRLAAGLVEGLTFSKTNVHTRCVPTAFAMGMALDSSSNDKIAAIFDGRNKEILLYELENNNREIQATGVTEVLNQQQAEIFFTNNKFASYVAFTNEATAIEKIVPASISNSINYLKHIPTENLIKSNLPYTDNLTELVYIRPAVYAKKQTKK